MSARHSGTGSFGVTSLSSMRLQEARDRLYSVVDHMIDGIVTFDDGGSIESANPAAHDMFGYSANELVGQSVKILMPVLDKIPRESVAAHLFADGGRREIEGRRKDDATFPIDLAVSEFRHEGGRYFTAIVRDITERKRGEERTRFLARSAALLSSVVDSASLVGRIAQIPVPLFADWCVVDLLGESGELEQVAAAHRDEQQARILRRLERPCAFPRRSGALIAEVVREQRSQWRVRAVDPFEVIEPADLLERQLVSHLSGQSMISAPLTVHNRTVGAVTFILSAGSRRYDALDLALAEDFAHRSAIAIENARLYDQAREADRRKDEFLAMLAHELRNPLAPIRNAVEILRSVELGSGQAKAVNAIDRQAAHMARLVDDLLDISRLMRGKIQLRFERIQLRDAIEKVVESWGPIIESRQHQFVVRLPKKPVWLSADPVRLDQIIANLLNNASKFTDRGGCIRLTARVQKDELLVSVRDNGIGIDANVLPKIFEPFRQAESTLERSQGGLGIGLSLVRKLVEMHGGTILAHSDGHGAGAEFIVRLPMLEDDPSYAEITHADDVERPSCTLSILVVDDNVDAAEMLSGLLALEGHHVVTVHDGLSALTAAEDLRPDVVLLDIGLPRLNGYEVARRLREEAGLEPIRIIAMTGYGQESDRQRALDAGCDEHLSKPVAPSTLRRCLAEVQDWDRHSDF
jgi:PAS domain S-box-containing protein